MSPNGFSAKSKLVGSLRVASIAASFSPRSGTTSWAGAWRGARTKPIKAAQGNANLARDGVDMGLSSLLIECEHEVKRQLPDGLTSTATKRQDTTGQERLQSKKQSPASMPESSGWVL